MDLGDLRAILGKIESAILFDDQQGEVEMLRQEAHRFIDDYIDKLKQEE